MLILDELGIEKPLQTLRNAGLDRSQTDQPEPEGCSKSPSSKAAASEGPRRTLSGTLRV